MPPVVFKELRQTTFKTQRELWIIKASRQASTSMKTNSDKSNNLRTLTIRELSAPKPLMLNTQALINSNPLFKGQIPQQLIITKYQTIQLLWTKPMLATTQSKRAPRPISTKISIHTLHRLTIRCNWRRAKNYSKSPVINWLIWIQTTLS